MRHLLLLSILFLACLRINAATTPDDPLAHLRPNHPRLLMTDEQLKDASAAAKLDPLRAELNKRIIATADFILTAPALRHNTQDKTIHEQERCAVYYILTSAMAYRLTSDERFLNRAKSDMVAVAAFPDWETSNELAV